MWKWHADRTCFHECSYDELSQSVREFHDRVVNQHDEMSVARVFETARETVRRFGLIRFRRSFGRLSPLGQCLLEVFLLARFRRACLGYLVLQEGSGLRADPFYPVAQTHFTEVGRRLQMRVALPWLFRRRLVFNLDPFCHLRAIYLANLRKGPAGVGRRLRTWFHRRMFGVKLTCYSLLAFLLERQLTASPLRVLRRTIEQHCLYLSCLLMPATRSFTRHEWNESFARITEYLNERLTVLSEVIGKESLSENGVAKLAKVALGTFVGRADFARRLPGLTPEFLVDSVRLAYCWGATYPLVDDVLDSPETSRQKRQELYLTLLNLFRHYSNGTEPPAAPSSTDGGILEIERCLREVLQIVPEARRASTARALELVLDAHRRDSARRLSEMGDVAPDEWKQVLVDTALKSALVRIATMYLSGIEVEQIDPDQVITSAVFNQLGDDLWDLADDLKNDRVTLFTLYAAGHDVPNPLTCYLKYAACVLGKGGQACDLSAHLGVAEVIRDAHLAACNAADPRARAAIERLLGDNHGVPDEVFATPHVDPDGVIFKLERIALGEPLPGAK